MINWEAYLGMFLGGMFKFIVAPATGAALSMSFIEIFVLSVSSMMFSVVIFTFFGIGIRNFITKRYVRKKKIFSPAKRRIVRIWKKNGMNGVAFFTPIFFSPIIGTMIAISFGEGRKSIILKMLISAVFWGILFSFVASYWGETAFKLLKNINFL
jgi:hypothetical protein